VTTWAGLTVVIKVQSRRNRDKMDTFNTFI